MQRSCGPVAHDASRGPSEHQVGGPRAEGQATGSSLLRLAAVSIPPPLHSKSQINKCGKLLASALYGGAILEETLDVEALDHAVTVVSDFRAAHGYPLGKVTMGLRSMVKTEGAGLDVTQRLKRLPRIVRKLHRMGNTSLARLQDIGGCRAVLPTLDHVDRVHKRIRHRWGIEIVNEKDYIADPKEIGYRAIHVVTRRDGLLIEVQLRTHSQQYWADQIEAADNRLGLSLKDGTGPPEMIEFFQAAGEMQHVLDLGREPTEEQVIRMTSARRAVVRAGYYAS